jgi:beta-lactamase class A
MKRILPVMSPHLHIASALAALLLLLPSVATADCRTGDGAYPELRDCVDSALQRGLEQLIRSHGLWPRVEQDRLTAAIADITDPRWPRFAAVRGDQMMYASSLPKVAILLAAYARAEEDGAEPDEALREDIRRMIRYSDNAAATRALDRIGHQTVLDVLQSPRLRLYDPAQNGGLWVGKDYASGPAYQRDPIHNHVHGATATQVARFYYLLATGRLVNAAHTGEIRALLGDPVFRNKFVRGLEARPEAKLFRKTGTWRIFHADGALVESGDRRLIMVAIAHDPQGGQWLVALAAPLYDLLMAR